MRGRLASTLPVLVAAASAGCWAPQRLVGMESSLEEFRAAVSCTEGERAPRDSCVERTWGLDRFVGANLDCRVDEDYVAVAGVEPIEVDRLAVNRRIQAELRRWWDELRDVCGDYDWFGSTDMRAVCRAGRCELVSPARSSIVRAGCDRKPTPRVAEDCRGSLERVTASYFPGREKSGNAQWLAYRLCLANEPSLEPMGQSGRNRVARCVLHDSFRPPLVLRLEEGSCRMTASRVEVGDGPPRVEREEFGLAECSGMLRHFIDAAKRGGGGRPVAPNTVVTDGSDWTAEWRDEHGHAVAEVWDPVTTEGQQTGVAAACQMLVTVYRVRVPAPLIPRHEDGT